MPAGRNTYRKISCRTVDNAKQRQQAVRQRYLPSMHLHAKPNSDQPSPSDRKEKATYPSVQEVESPVTLSTIPNGFVPFPRSVHGMRCWLGPPGCHDLLRYLACWNTELRGLGQMWRKIGRTPGKRRSSEVIRSLRTLRAHGRGGFDWISTGEVEGAFRL